jgi:acetyl/propionyl-CoA carboxylase alpha subunit
MTAEITPIRRLAIANRGEIARRIIRTCRAMGIESVALYSDADARAPFVAEADIAVRLGPAEAAASYLSIDAVIDAAARAGARAIHPGYGFLAENADFAEAVGAAGLIWIGPTPEVIRNLGSKIRAKEIAAGAGVPNIPTFDPARPEAIDYPVLLKASAGGGGKGMTVVRSAGDLAAALESAKRIAASAFGDDAIMIEKLIERPRHIEVQILGDKHGDVIHLGERECSIQRRHQKIIEESPSPAVDADLRARICGAALGLAREVGYQSAGTVEMILAPDGDFYFLEVNTRLQVEHPVTELVYGVDLVREQIRVAEGRRLELTQDAIRPRGHAIEARLYAEDPSAGDLPQTGVIAAYVEPPGVDRRSDPPGLAAPSGRVRCDSGVEAGSEVTVHYDPMLAKIIAAAPTRSESIRALWRGLGELRVAGVRTNRGFLRALLSHPELERGETDTGFVGRHREALIETEGPEWPAIAAALHAVERRRAARAILPALEPDFRISRFADPSVSYALGDREIDVSYRNLGDRRFAVRCGEIDETVEVREVSPRAIGVVDAAGLRRRFSVTEIGARVAVSTADADWLLAEAPRFPDASASRAAGSCVSPMPGKIVAVKAAVGDVVEAGQVLVVLEAMKMEHVVAAPHAGEVIELSVEVGQQVDGDAILAVVEAS